MEVRLMLVDPEFFDERFDSVLREAPTGRDMLRSLIAPQDDARFVAEALVFAKAAGITGLYDGNIPDLCPDALEQELSSTNGLFDLLERVLLELYSTKHLSGLAVQPPVSLLYLRGVQALDPRVVETFCARHRMANNLFAARLRRHLERQIARRGLAPGANVAGMRLRELRALVCGSLRPARERAPAPDTFEELKRLEETGLLHGELRIGAVSIGPLPKRWGHVEPNTLYVGRGTPLRGECFLAEPDWDAIREAYYGGKRVVFEGSGGVMADTRFETMMQLAVLGARDIHAHGAPESFP